MSGGAGAAVRREGGERGRVVVVLATARLAMVGETKRKIELYKPLRCTREGKANGILENYVYFFPTYLKALSSSVWTFLASSSSITAEREQGLGAVWGVPQGLFRLTGETESEGGRAWTADSMTGRVSSGVGGDVG